MLTTFECFRGAGDDSARREESFPQAASTFHAGSESGVVQASFIASNAAPRAGSPATHRSVSARSTAEPSPAR